MAKSFFKQKGNYGRKNLGALGWKKEEWNKQIGG